MISLGLVSVALAGAEQEPRAPCTGTLHSNVGPFKDLLDTKALEQQFPQGIQWTGQPISVKCKDARYTMEMKCDKKARLKVYRAFESGPMCGKWWDSKNKKLTEGCTSFADGVDDSLFRKTVTHDIPGSGTFTMKPLGWHAYYRCKYNGLDFVTFECQTKKDSTGKDVTALYQQFEDKVIDNKGTARTYVNQCPQPSCSWLSLTDRQKQYVNPEQLEQLQAEFSGGQGYRDIGHTEPLQCLHADSKMLLKCEDRESHYMSASQDVDGHVNECPEPKWKYKLGECDRTCGSFNRGYLTFEWQCTVEGKVVNDETCASFEYDPEPDVECTEELPPCDEDEITQEKLLRV